MPTLAELLNSNKRQPVGPRCAVCVLLTTLTDDDRADMQAALDDPAQFSAVGIARAVTATGFTLGRSSVERHRRGDCATGTR